MGVAGIINNIKLYGVQGTYEIYKKRQKEREKAELSNRENVQLMDALRKRCEEKYPEEKYSEEKRKKLYKRELKSYFIREIYPRVYNEEAKKPVEHKIVFMERGPQISPSLKYMLDYVKKNTDYEVKTFTLQVREVPDDQYYMNAKDYIREAATAKAIFVCTASDLMGYFELRPETTYIQLWHGCGAFKKVGLSTIDKKFGKSAKGHEKYPLNTNYSYVTIASPELSWIFEESMGIDKESGIIVPTGISRTDEFFEPEFVDNCYKKLYEAIPQAKDKKVILYAPTFRGQVSSCTSPDELDVKKFSENLGDEYILIFKHHQSVKVLPEIPEPYKGTFAFDMTRDSEMNINELMTVADICISDYSSVVFEYSLFERPMLFFVFDLEEYIDERGLYYDFDEITPGPLCRTNDEMIDYIKHVDERFNKQEVTDFKNRFMCCCDGHSSERILALIK
ncbi:MAG: CDP-glycerol glycerophosphotransferase family protein [Lachnospiraceae bacterium]